MKKNIIIASSFLLMSLASCNKLIEIKDTDAITGELALGTVANNESAIIGAYAAEQVEQGILLNATFSDEVRKGEFYAAQTTHEWQYGSTDVGLRDSYQSIYEQNKVIDRVNRVLIALPNATSTIASAPTDAALKLKLRGEALFLRAFAHFEMYRFYSNSATGTDLAMPYMTTPSLGGVARLTVTDFMAKLKTDLDEAKTLLPDFSATADIARATKVAVSALQARVALYTQQWATASTTATEFINAIPLATRANFPGIWTDANKSELGFNLIRTATVTSVLGRLGSLWRGTSTTTNIGQVSWFPSNALLATYDQVNDIRYSSYFKNEPLMAARPSQILISKYAGGSYGTTTENVANAKVFRTGEMYLIRAEAKAETNDLTGAAADLNALRAARINGYVNATFATKADLITAIMAERFKELPYEGHRFFDLKRRHLPVTRIASDAPSATAGISLPADNFRFLLPIPNLEIQTNPLMQQNPGYTN